MVSVLELIDPIYFLPIGAFFIILVGCACYGCYDLFNPHSDLSSSIGGGVIACDLSDCPIPDIHEQHKLDKGGGFWSRKAWGLDPSSAENSRTDPGDYTVMMIPPPTLDNLGGAEEAVDISVVGEEALEAVGEEDAVCEGDGKIE